MKSAGIGGGVYLEVNIGIPRGPRAVHERAVATDGGRCIRAADALDWRWPSAAGAGWCGAGGPWVKPEESMQFLETSVTRVHGPGNFSGQFAQTKAADAVLR